MNEGAAFYPETDYPCLPAVCLKPCVAPCCCSFAQVTFINVNDEWRAEG